MPAVRCRHFAGTRRSPGRLVVTNHPARQRAGRGRLSNGRGLLADGGVSLSNVFSGDAPTSLLTMSTVGAGRDRRGPTRGVGAYLVDGYGLTRSLVLTVGEMVKELYQSRRQRLQRIEPRGHRPCRTLLLRGVTNVLLRDLNLSLIAEHMMRGSPSVYCDFVDYDEIAHHAGPVRPNQWRRSRESTASWAPWNSSRRMHRGRTISSSCPTTGRARAPRSSSGTESGSRTSSAS